MSRFRFPPSWAATSGLEPAPTPTTPDGRLSASHLNGIDSSYTYDSSGNLVSDTEGAATTTFDYGTNGLDQLLSTTTGSAVTDYGWDTSNAWRTSQGPDSNLT